MSQLSSSEVRTEGAQWPFSWAQDAWNYSIDAWQRGFLFLDVLEQRSSQYYEHAAKPAPHVLKFACELVMDGRELPRPVNYALVRIVPPDGKKSEKYRRPFVVVDPRAGHGPGIGGFKPQSEIGVAIKAGHPCYFIGFLPDPIAGQTIEDVAQAEAAFLKHVIDLHPEADGKPAVIGNCQAGWAVVMLAAARPELFGPLILAGSPLSYWAGSAKQNPMRYTGGLWGGTWIAALLGDLGNGKFDGAWLVSNFENLNPSNTLWRKHYNLYSKIDTEAPRYIEFEQWWGGHVLLNSDEMQYIADELFVGNKLSTAGLSFSDGTRIDLRHIRSPIVIFCSKADNITPPPQALDWILDLYDSIDDIRAHGQTIVYAVHESIGHLGIFVSGSVAKKEHDEFASNIDLIDSLPPGLYEVVMTAKDSAAPGADLIAGNYLVRFEARTLDDIRALGVNSREDDREFAAAARVSDINLGLYRTFVRPWVRLWANEGVAEWMRRFHPLRMQYEIFSNANPFLNAVLSNERLLGSRQRVSKDNIFWQAQEQFSDGVTSALDTFRDLRDNMVEAWFHAVYGSPLLQALVGLSASDESPLRKPGDDATHHALVLQKIEELKRRIPDGGPREALIRALLYVRMPDAAVDERGFNLLRQMREDAGKGLDLAAFKRVVREQFLMLLLDERRAVSAIPAMLATNSDLAARTKPKFDRMIELFGVHSKAARARLAEVEALLECEDAEPVTTNQPNIVPPAREVRRPRHH
jgi:pimeloyl-ACP methyl ester carboxylesterase